MDWPKPGPLASLIITALVYNPASEAPSPRALTVGVTASGGFKATCGRGIHSVSRQQGEAHTPYSVTESARILRSAPLLVNRDALGLNTFDREAV